MLFKRNAQKRASEKVQLRGGLASSEAVSFRTVFVEVLWSPFRAKEECFFYATCAKPVRTCTAIVSRSI